MNETPVLILIFNRPEYTQQLFNVLAKAKPSNIYIACDGPRRDYTEDLKLVTKTRAIFDNINWNCTVRKLYREENLSCGPAVSSAIDWFFSQVEYGIILEDDCIPSLSFFDYCSLLLEKYKDNENIMMIGGHSLIDSNTKININETYFFTYIVAIWGWASWKRAWNKYQLQITPDMISAAEQGLVWSEFKYKEIRQSKIETLTSTYNGNVNTWDIQWDYTISVNKGICILPFQNLISNIGKYGTNYIANKDVLQIRSAHEIDTNNIIHPKEIAVNNKIDNFYQKLRKDELSKINEPLIQYAINKTKNYIVRFLRFIKIYQYIK